MKVYSIVEKGDRNTLYSERTGQFYIFVSERDAWKFIFGSDAPDKYEVKEIRLK